MKAISSLASDEFISSDVGFIPKSWQCQPLRSLLIESPKYGINAPAVALESDIPVYIRITDISEDGYFRPGEKVGVRSPISHLYRLQEGDIVLARTGASVGKSYLYNADDGELVYAGFLIKVSCDQSLFLPRFLRHFLHTEFFWSWVKVNSMRSGQPGINGNEFARLPIPVPPLSEQTAIANALSDVDALIQELEKLIAKKQAIKTATMQQLLTGRTRLPQFVHHPDGRKKGYKASELGEIPEDWELMPLGELTEVIRNGSNYKTIFKDGVPVTRIETIAKGFIDFDRTGIASEESIHSSYKLKDGDILYSHINSVDHIGKVAMFEGDRPLYHGINLLLIRVDHNTSSNWLYSYLSFFPSREWAKKIAKQAVSQASINTKELKQLVIPTPMFDEQEAIGLALKEFDHELELCKLRLDKTRQIKQGMMQELLTGKTRLVKPESSV